MRKRIELLKCDDGLQTGPPDGGQWEKRLKMEEDRVNSERDGQGWKIIKHDPLTGVKGVNTSFYHVWTLGTGPPDGGQNRVLQYEDHISATERHTEEVRHSFDSWRADLSNDIFYVTVRARIAVLQSA